MKNIEKVRAEFKGAQTEIGIGKVLVGTTEADRAWNNACDLAIRIIQRYINGKGLFQ